GSPADGHGPTSSPPRSPACARSPSSPERQTRRPDPCPRHGGATPEPDTKALLRSRAAIPRPKQRSRHTRTTPHHRTAPTSARSQQQIGGSRLSLDPPMGGG